MKKKRLENWIAHITLTNSLS